MRIQLKWIFIATTVLCVIIVLLKVVVSTPKGVAKSFVDIADARNQPALLGLPNDDLIFWLEDRNRNIYAYTHVPQSELVEWMANCHGKIDYYVLPGSPDSRRKVQTPWDSHPFATADEDVFHYRCEVKGEILYVLYNKSTSEIAVSTLSRNFH